MSDTNINPVSYLSAVAVGMAGAVIATDAKPLAKKVVKMSEPIVDTVSVSAKRAAATAENGFSKLVEYMENIIDLLGKTVQKGLKTLKNFFANIKEQIKTAEMPKPVSQIADKTVKLAKSPALIAGITAGALYAGYKIVSSQRED